MLNDNDLMRFISTPNERMDILKKGINYEQETFEFAFPDLGKAFLSGIWIILGRTDRIVEVSEGLDTLASELKLLLIAELMEETEAIE